MLKFKQKIVEQNIVSMSAGFDFGKCPLFIMMSDEVAVEPSPSIDLETNEITGICCEHAGDVELIVTSHEVPSQVRIAVDEGKAHAAKECIITSIAVFGRKTSIAMPIFASATCKGGGHKIQETQIKGCMDAFNKVAKSHLGNGKLVAFGTDGEAARRQANLKVLNASQLSNDSPLYTYLSGLRGLDRRVGPGDVVASSDEKHLYKRLRTRFTSRSVDMHIGHLFTPMKKTIQSTRPLNHILAIS